MNFDALQQAMIANAQAVNNLNQTFLAAVQAQGTGNSTATSAVQALGTLASTYAYPIPPGAVAITAASGNVAAASAIATLAAAPGKTTYLTGFHITSGGATGASLVSVTVAGVITGTLTYTYGVVAGAAVPNADLLVIPPRPIPGSAVNTAIVVTLPSLGVGNTNATVVAYGYQL